MTTFYVDVSHHDRDRRGSALDWSQILAATSSVMIAKVTEGDPASFASTDPYGVQALKDARAAGATMRGGYHVPRHGDQASTFRQVDFFRRQLDQGGANWAMLDSEPFDELGTNWPRFSDIQRFDDRWYALEQRVLVHYLPHSFWDERLGRPSLTTLQGPLVNPNYGDNPIMSPAALYLHRGGDGSAAWNPYGGRPVDIFQFGSQCRVPGASPGTDINAFRGSQPELITLLRGGAMTTDINLAQPILNHPELTLNNLWYSLYVRVPSNLDAHLSGLDAQINGLTSKVDGVAGKIGSAGSVTLSEEDRAAIAAAVLAGLDTAALTNAVADAVIAKLATLRFGVQG